MHTKPEAWFSCRRFIFLLSCCWVVVPSRSPLSAFSGFLHTHTDTFAIPRSLLCLVYPRCPAHFILYFPFTFPSSSLSLPRSSTLSPCACMCFEFVLLTVCLSRHFLHAKITLTQNFYNFGKGRSNSSFSNCHRCVYCVLWTKNNTKTSAIQCIDTVRKEA